MTTEKQQRAAEAVAWRLEDEKNRTVAQACEMFGVNLHSYYRVQQGKKGKPKAAKAKPKTALVQGELFPSKPTTQVLAPPAPAASTMLAGKTIVIVTDTKDLMMALSGLGFRGM